MRHTLTLLALLLCSLAARPLRAQAPADTTGLAQAIASVVPDSMLAYWVGTKPVVWDYAGTALDSAVAAIVARNPRLHMSGPPSPLSAHVSLPSVSVDGDSARVSVRIDHRYRMTGTLTFYIRDEDFFFHRTGAGWQFVRRSFVRHADGGPVRG